MTARLTVNRERIGAFRRNCKVKEMSLFGSVLTDEQVANAALQCNLKTMWEGNA